jgi:hypothetical protein
MNIIKIGNLEMALRDLVDTLGKAVYASLYKYDV